MGIWSTWMDTTVTVAPRDTEDDYGEWTAGTQRTVKGRLERESQDVRDAEGNITSRRDVFYTHENIGHDEFVWLPGANTSNLDEARTPYSREPSPDPTGGETLYKVVL
jgi:hypothetical protein